MKKFLMVCEAYGGGVFIYVAQLCNDMFGEFEVYLVFALRPQIPENYKDFLDGRVHLIEVGGIGRLAFKGKRNTVIYTLYRYAHILLGNGAKCKMYGIMEAILGRASSAVTVTYCESEDDVGKGLTNKSAYIETCVNIAELTASLECIEPVRDGKFKVFKLGRGCVQKQPQLFNRIAELVPEARFLWIENGELESQLTDPNIEVTDWKPRKEALTIAKGADVFVIYSFGEAIAMDLIENMFMKKLVLVNNAMGNGSVIKDGMNRYVCNSAEEYAERIKCAMKVVPRLLSVRTYQDVLDIYNVEVIKEKYINFYNKIMPITYSGGGFECSISPCHGIRRSIHFMQMVLNKAVD